MSAPVDRVGLVRREPLVLDEMLYFIEDAIRKQPRSLQKRIGPSQLGTPCVRKLAHRLHQTEPINTRAVAWQAQVGTSVHSWLTEVFIAVNAIWPDSEPRWLTDLKVSVGVINGQVITGHLDLYDAGTQTVIDWKIPGPSSMKSKRAHGPGDEYRTQLHLYAKGAIAAGLPVTDVGLLALPAAGTLEDYWYWTEPYNETIAVAALGRADAIAAALDLMPEMVLTTVATADDFCRWCDYFRPGAPASAHSCPGDESLGNTGAPALVFKP